MEHNILALKTKDCIFNVAPDWETKFQLGDSISKKKSELIVEHYRNEELIEILDYHDVAKHRNSYYIRTWFYRTTKVFNMKEKKTNTPQNVKIFLSLIVLLPISPLFLYINIELI